MVDNIGSVLSRMNNLTKQAAFTKVTSPLSQLAMQTAGPARKPCNRTMSSTLPTGSQTSSGDQKQQDKAGGFRKLNSVASWWRSSNEKEPAVEQKAAKTSAFDLLKDPIKDMNQKLYEEYDLVQSEYKQLKSYIEHLEREYAESKELFDFFRRYQKLKGMIKRLVMYLKLSNNELIDTNLLHGGANPGVIGLLQSTREFVKKSEMSKVRKQKHAAMNSEQLSRENEELQTSIKATRRRVALIKELIIQTEAQYDDSKRYFPIQRYRLMKGMVKHVITNQLIRDNTNC